MPEREQRIIRVGTSNEATSITVIQGAEPKVVSAILPVVAGGHVSGGAIAELLAERDDSGNILKDETGRTKINTTSLDTVKKQILEQPYNVTEREGNLLYSLQEPSVTFSKLISEIEPETDQILGQVPTFGKMIKSTAAELELSPREETELVVEYLLVIARQHHDRMPGFSAATLQETVQDAYKLVSLLERPNINSLKKYEDSQARDAQEEGFRVIGRFITELAVAYGVEEAVNDRLEKGSQLDFPSGEPVLDSGRELHVMKAMIQSARLLEQLARSLRETDAPLPTLYSESSELAKRAAELEELRRHAAGVGNQDMSKGNNRFREANVDALESILDRSE